MKFTFDYYKSLEMPDFLLCNPDKTPLGVLNVKNENFALRLDSISDLTFIMPEKINVEGELVVHPLYSMVETKRLIFVDGVGWFRINVVQEKVGTEKCKEVTAQSHECVFKDFGFIEENRVYSLYNENDPTDSLYNSSDDEAIPSVVGQLYQQLGVSCADVNSDIEPDADYGNWTIIYIDPEVKNGVYRTLKGNSELFGYDFMMKDVREAFQISFVFDFLTHTIKIKTAKNIAKQTDIVLSFDNLIKEIDVKENSEEIVTVLSCEGNNLDISSVNPMGTKYICDFSYYMGNESKGYKWMSKELTDELTVWKALLDSKKDEYSELSERLYEAELQKTEVEERKVGVDQKTKDIENVRDQYISDPDETKDKIFIAEVKTMNFPHHSSRDPESIFYDEKLITYGDEQRFDVNFVYHTEWKCYKTPPTYDGAKFTFSRNTDGNTGICNENGLNGYVYFIDNAEGDNCHTYCKLIYETKNIGNGENVTTSQVIKGFERYAKYSDSSYWYDQWVIARRNAEAQVHLFQTNDIDPIIADMKAIANQVNILKYFSTKERLHLYGELKNYWVDGTYTNDTLEGLDGETVADNLKLAKELMQCGEIELAKICQPRLSLEITSANFIKMNEFVNFSNQLALGVVLNIEREPGLYYYPALTEMSFSFSSDVFSLKFSNGSKLTDWGFTYADLIANAASTSRKVSSNWSNLIDYSENKVSINELLVNSLDSSLRAGLSNSYNQEFVVDETGILGRKFADDSKTSFNDEQIRIINNQILFTTDNWKTASLALGKIKYTDSSGKETSAYGLATSVLIGDLILGDKMNISGTLSVGNNLTIGNDNVLINSNGIAIKKGYIQSDNYRWDTSEVWGVWALSGCRINLSPPPSEGDDFIDEDEIVYVPEDDTALIRSRDFVIDKDGNAYFSGMIEGGSLSTTWNKIIYNSDKQRVGSWRSNTYIQGGLITIKGDGIYLEDCDGIQWSFRPIMQYAQTVYNTEKKINEERYISLIFYSKGLVMAPDGSSWNDCGIEFIEGKFTDIHSKVTNNEDIILLGSGTTINLSGYVMTGGGGTDISETLVYNKYRPSDIKYTNK